MANVTVLQWRDSTDAFLEPESGIKTLLAAWACQNRRGEMFEMFAEYLAERLEPMAQVVAREFEKACMAVEVVVLWRVMRHSGMPYLTLDLGVRESGDDRIYYHIARWSDLLLSRQERQEEVRVRVELWLSWLVNLSGRITKNDPGLRLAIRELGCAFSRRRTLPEKIHMVPVLAGGRRATLRYGC